MATAPLTQKTTELPVASGAATDDQYLIIQGGVTKRVDMALAPLSAPTGEALAAKADNGQVQQLINAHDAQVATIAQQKVDAAYATSIIQSGPYAGMTVLQAFSNISAALAGNPSPATITGAPAISDTTPDWNQALTINTLGTYSFTGGVTLVSRSWDIQIDGAVVANIGQVGFTSSLLGATAASRSLRVIEKALLSNNTTVSNPSASYTFNTPAAVPIATGKPTWGPGAPQEGTSFTLNAAPYNPAATSYVRSVNSGVTVDVNGDIVSEGTVAQSYASTASTTSGFTVPVGTAGLSLRILELASNGAGAATKKICSDAIIIASGAAPNWVDAQDNTLAGAVRPHILVNGQPASSAAVGDVISIDWGTTVGAADSNGYSGDAMLDGNTVIASIAKQGNFSFQVQSAWSGHEIGFKNITAWSPGGGTGLPVSIDAIVIAGTSSGGGSGGFLSGSLVGTPNNSASTPFDTASLGTYDFAEYVSGSGALAVGSTKSGGPAAISVAMSIGTNAYTDSTSHIWNFVAWTGGTSPSPSTGYPNGVDGYSYITPDANGVCEWEFTIAASTTRRTLSIVSLIAAGDDWTLTASLSDGSANNLSLSGTGPSDMNVLGSIDFQSGDNNSRTMTVKLRKTTNNTNALYLQLVGIK